MSATAAEAGAPALADAQPDTTPRRSRARIRLTRSGWMVTLVSLAVMMAAANTANNLLYLLLGLLLSAYPVSAWLAWAAVRRLDGELLVPDLARAGAHVDIAASLQVVSGSGAPGIVAEIRGLDARAQTAFTPDATPFTWITRDAGAIARFVVAPRRRGPVRVRLVARCPHPFGLLEAEREIDAQEMLVLPESLRGAVGSPPLSAAEGRAMSRRGPGIDILDIRDYRFGDDARRMDWKATARLDRPMIREYAREEDRRAVIVADPGRVRGSGAPLGSVDDPMAERAIARAAGAVEDLASRGWRLRLLAPGVEQGGEPEALLRSLALLEVKERGEADWWMRHVDERETLLVFRADEAT